MEPVKRPIFDVRDGMLLEYNGNDAVVTVPDGVTVIETLAFDKCYQLEKVILPESVEVIETHAFFQCTRLTEVVLPKKLQRICGTAFADCRKLREISIPQDTVVEGGAFSRCTIDRVDFGERTDFTSIYDSTLLAEVNRCILCHNEMEETPDGRGMQCRSCGQAFTYEEILDWPAFAVEDKVCVRYMGGGYLMPRGIEKIGYRAFDDGALLSMYIPDSVTEIEEEAFLWCDVALSIHLPHNLRRLERKVFCGSNIRGIYLPEKLETIGELAFCGCEALRNIELPPSVKTIEESAFEGCEVLEDVVLNEGLESIGVRAFAACKNLRELTIPESVTHIGEGAFDECDRLSLVYFPAHLYNAETKKLFPSYVTVLFTGLNRGNKGKEEQ